MSPDCQLYIITKHVLYSIAACSILNLSNIYILLNHHHHHQTLHHHHTEYKTNLSYLPELGESGRLLVLP